MHKQFAYWERSPTGWVLVVYHDYTPAKSVNGSSPDRVGPWPVPAEIIDIDASPNLGLIAKAFPEPAKENYSDDPAQL